MIIGEELSPETKVFHPKWGEGEIVFRAQNASYVYRCVFKDEDGDEEIYKWCKHQSLHVLTV